MRNIRWFKKWFAVSTAVAVIGFCFPHSSNAESKSWYWYLKGSRTGSNSSWSSSGSSGKSDAGQKKDQKTSLFDQKTTAQTTNNQKPGGLNLPQPTSSANTSGSQTNQQTATNTNPYGSK